MKHTLPESLKEEVDVELGLVVKVNKPVDVEDYLCLRVMKNREVKGKVYSLFYKGEKIE